jgi:hypothetical protein
MPVSKRCQTKASPQADTDPMPIRFRENLTIECICPKCGVIHRMKLLWSGRGRPKKYCQTCKIFVSTLESIECCNLPSLVSRSLEKTG